MCMVIVVPTQTQTLYQIRYNYHTATGSIINNYTSTSEIQLKSLGTKNCKIHLLLEKVNFVGKFSGKRRVSEHVETVGKTASIEN